MSIPVKAKEKDVCFRLKERKERKEGKERGGRSIYKESIINGVRAFPAPLRGLILILGLYPGPRPGSKMIPPLRGCTYPDTEILPPDKHFMGTEKIP